MDEILQLKMAFNDLLNGQQFDGSSLDYSFFEHQKNSLNALATLGHSSVSVFDNFKREHIFHSLNFGDLLGYDVAEISKEGYDFIEHKIHPLDYRMLLENSLNAMRIQDKFSPDEKYNYKFISEYRLQNVTGTYIRMIEQHQIFKLDDRGNTWLTLSIVDVSPNQNETEGVVSRLLNFRTGKVVSLPAEADTPQHNLTRREKEVLQMVKEGLLSKEISDRLSISMHTVNTHRQRVLEKLGVNNSIEAIILASRLGLLD